MENYPYKSEERLSEAEECLGRMSTSVDGDSLRRAFLSFLNSTRFALQPLLKDHKGKLNGFDDWWKTGPGVYMENDEICSFFREIRNTMTKADEDPFNYGFCLGGKGVMNGPLQIHADGTVLFGRLDAQGVPYWEVAKDVPGERSLIFCFKNPPDSLKSKNPLELSRNYLDTLREILDDFKKHFLLRR